MKTSLTLLLLFFMTLTARTQTQNLVPNPSFEQYDTCPYYGGQLKYAIPWSNTQNLSSPDYFNSCASGIVGVPDNYYGSQNAQEGNAYAGIIVDAFSTLHDNSREYIEIKLVEKLRAGFQYCIEFYISAADSENYFSNDIGVYFSANQVFDSTQNSSEYPLSNLPQVSNSASINRNDWTKFSGIFTSAGDEQYIVIGNFKDHLSTSSYYTAWTTLPGNFAFDYIDNIALFKCDSAATIVMPNIFTPNADGLNDLFVPIEIGSVDEARLKIFNRWGQQIFMTDNIYEGWNGENFSDGVYYWELNYANLSEMENKSAGYVVLMR